MQFLEKNGLLITSIVLLFIVSAAIFFYQAKERERFVVFFSGAGMKIPVSEIVRDFTEKTGIKVDVHFEGSAILRQHIETYGGIDLFMSGDKKNMDILTEKGFVRESRFIAWHIPSILIQPETGGKIKGLNDLAKEGVRIVMSNPQQASLGRLVNDMLKRHPQGSDILNNVVVYGSDSQDDLRLFRDLHGKGKADAVIEWDVMAYVPEGKGLAVVPFEKEYEIKDQLALALLKASRNPEMSRKFYDYFKTEGISVFKKHGYNTGAR
ncbi:MAG: molybdate ABC transporter substrate-binding protein [Nitrospirae bacterium]|nr:molybdate ABC transporter substrate-binding protein [Nitrospirota bacterium]